MEIAGVSYFKFVLALAFVLGLIAIISVMAKKFGLGHRGPVGRGASKRLSIVETMPLDAKRRVILIRRDGKEHLLLMGGEREQIIEQDIDAEDRPDMPPAEVTPFARILSKS